MGSFPLLTGRGGTSGDISRAIVKVGLSGSTLTFTHGDGAKHSVIIPQSGAQVPTGLTNEIQKLEQKLTSQGVDVAGIKSQVGTLQHDVTSLTGIYSYRGSTAPTYPADKKNVYFIDIGNQNADLPFTMPNKQLNDGSVFFVDNESDQHRVIINRATGESIESATSLTLEPLQFVMLVKAGSNWVKAATGYIPSSLSDLENRVVNSIHGKLHTKQEITDMMNSWLGNPTTQSNLDKIIVALGYQKQGTPVKPHPSTVVVHYGVGDGYPTDFTGETGTVQPHQSMRVPSLAVDPKYVWVAVPKAQAANIAGFEANAGLAARWSSKDITVGTDQWTVFLSPTRLADDSLELTIKWSI